MDIQRVVQSYFEPIASSPHCNVELEARFGYIKPQYEFDVRNVSQKSVFSPSVSEHQFMAVNAYMNELFEQSSWSGKSYSRHRTFEVSFGRTGHNRMVFDHPSLNPESLQMLMSKRSIEKRDVKVGNEASRTVATVRLSGCVERTMDSISDFDDVFPVNGLRHKERLSYIVWSDTPYLRVDVTTVQVFDVCQRFSADEAQKLTRASFATSPYRVNREIEIEVLSPSDSCSGPERLTQWARRVEELASVVFTSS